MQVSEIFRIFAIGKEYDNMDKALFNTIKEYFKSKPVDKVWVFGSFSRGEERADSDVDIIVAITPGAKFSLLDHS